MNEFATLMKDLLKEMKSKSAATDLPVSMQLWTHDQIADYLRLAPEYVRKNVITNTHFPPVRPIPTDKSGERYAQRWRASEVIEWAMSIDKSTFDPTKPVITRSPSPPKH